MSEAAPIDILRQAHDKGLEKLGTLSRAVSRLDGEGSQAARNALKEVLHFFDTELELHFRHEEQALFPALTMIIGREGPIAAMLGEHQSLWRAVDTLKERLESLESTPNSRAAQGVKLVADHIVGLLAGHIGKEDSMLFPLAEESLSAHTMQQLAEQIKAIEQAA